jgi:putative endopeptidase
MILGAICFLNLQVSAQHDSKPVKKLSFIDKSSMDLTKKPGDDFYNYASGTWIKNNPVPAKETRWGSFNLLRDFNINAV